MLARALTIAREVDDPDLLADVECTTVRAALDANQAELAKEHLAGARAALAEFGYPQAAPAPFLSAALTTAAQVYAKAGQLEQAESFAMAALRLSESIARNPRQSADVGEALLVVASVKRARGDASAAADYAGRSVEALSKSLGQQHRLTRDAVALAVLR